MKLSREILLKAGLLPKLQLGIKTPGGGVKATGKHTVKVLEAEKIIRKAPKEEGDDGYYMRYVFEEDGEKKQYDTRLREKGGTDPSYFVQAMANVEVGEVITLEMKKQGVKNYIEIIRVAAGEVERVEDDEKDEAVDALDRALGGEDVIQ